MQHRGDGSHIPVSTWETENTSADAVLKEDLEHSAELHESFCCNRARGPYVLQRRNPSKVTTTREISFKPLLLKIGEFYISFYGIIFMRVFMKCTLNFFFFFLFHLFIRQR